MKDWKYQQCDNEPASHEGLRSKPHEGTIWADFPFGGGQRYWYRVWTRVCGPLLFMYGTGGNTAAGGGT